MDCIVVLGAFGDRLDQTLANINTLYEANLITKLPVYLLADRSLGCLLRPVSFYQAAKSLYLKKLMGLFCFIPKPCLSSMCRGCILLSLRRLASCQYMGKIIFFHQTDSFFLNRACPTTIFYLIYHYEGYTFDLDLSEFVEFFGKQYNFFLELLIYPRFLAQGCNGEDQTVEKWVNFSLPLYKK